jgi:hypothetical protein
MSESFHGAKSSPISRIGQMTTTPVAEDLLPPVRHGAYWQWNKDATPARTYDLRTALVRASADVRRVFRLFSAEASCPAILCGNRHPTPAQFYFHDPAVPLWLEDTAPLGMVGWEGIYATLCTMRPYIWWGYAAMRWYIDPCPVWRYTSHKPTQLLTVDQLTQISATTRRIAQPTLLLTPPKED